MLQLIHYENASKLLKCDIPAIQAVDDVESAGNGFLKSGKLKILFEGHYFYKFTNGLWSKDYPTLCYKDWTTEFYIGGEGEYQRFNKAMKLSPTAAMLSTSWGRYQIMGFNFGVIGYKSVGEMVDDFKKGEPEQLAAFVNYVIESGIDDELREHKWAAFAYRYNGSSYKKNKYDLRLAEAYQKFVNK